MCFDWQKFIEVWREMAVAGKVIQIRGREILFQPDDNTVSFWVYCEEKGGALPTIGACRLIIQAGIFHCDQIFQSRGQEVKTPELSLHNDHIERVRGRTLSMPCEAGFFAIDAGFPLVVGLLEDCDSPDKFRVGSILEMEVADPTLALPVGSD